MAKWRNKIKIKHLLDSNESEKKVIELCDCIVPQLKRIYERERKIAKISEEILEELKDLIEDFIWIKEAIKNNQNADKYSFNSWIEAFNELMDQLYDLGDTLITKRNFYDDEKFLWVG